MPLRFELESAPPSPPRSRVVAALALVLNTAVLAHGAYQTPHIRLLLGSLAAVSAACAVAVWKSAK